MATVSGNKRIAKKQKNSGTAKQQSGGTTELRNSGTAEQRMTLTVATGAIQA
ncbi:hypothetical protein [Paenibacillus sp. GXUN7292]|uniref:hypothetical protein n=1 Tax=Paenibacillus sp. GXUN7292 TaxID=3422499 RepID=UPI003D7D4E75